MLYQGDNESLKKYSIVMVVFGVSLFGLPIFLELLPDLFRWHEPAVNMADERMIVSMYYALGICFLMGAKDPVRNSIIIDYTIISSVLHGLVMAYYAMFVLETVRSLAPALDPPSTGSAHRRGRNFEVCL
jgi:hypothetical protein